MIALYCPDLPPVPGGLPDHTAAVARALARLGAAPAVLGRRGEPSLLAPLTCVTGLAPGDVAAAARAAGADTVLIEYTPFLYARRGVSPALVSAVRRMRRAGLRLGVFVHEPWVPFTRLPWLVTGWPQRWQLRDVLGHCAFVYTPVPAWVTLLAAHTANGTAVTVAPVGANLAPADLGRDEARAALGLSRDDVAIGVFSPAASGFRHDWVRHAAARLAGSSHRVWVRFGFGSDRGLPQLPEGARCLTVGPGEQALMARTMRAMDLVAAPFVDGLTLRRGSAMFALASGIATVSSTGPLHDPALAALAACEPSAEAFAARIERLAREPAERQALAERARGYGEVASTEVLARRLATDLVPGWTG
jgi:glycosyltransferase involved in cell wall biosynthesis